jgi:signal transduction histidine kinase
MAIKMKKTPSFHLAGITATGFLFCLFVCLCPTAGQEPRKDMAITFPGIGDTGAVAQRVKSAEELGITHPDSAMLLITDIIEESRRLTYVHGIGLGLAAQGRVLIGQGKYEEAEKKLMLSLPYFLNTEEGKRILPVVVSNLGNIYYYKGAYEKSVRYFFRSINMMEKIPGLRIGYVYGNTAGALSHLGRNPEAVRYYLDKAERIALEEKNYLTLGQVYVNKGVSYLQSKVWDSSLYYFEKGLAIGQSKKLPKIEHLALTNLGINYLEQNIPDKALPYLYAADAIKNDIAPFTQNFSRIALGNALMQLKRYKEAEPILLQQYQYAVAQDLRGNVREAHYNLSKLYAGMQNYQKAYQHALDYMMLNDTLAGTEIMDRVNNMEVNYRTVEKEKALVKAQLFILKQEKDIERKNLWNTIIGFAALVLILIFFMIWRGYRAKKKLLTEELNSMEKQQEIERLKATIDGEEKERIRIARELHDGVGGLVSVVKMNVATMHESPYSPKGEMLYRDTIRILDEMGADLRITAHNMIPDALLHQNIAEAITNFCNSIQRSKGLPIEVQVYGNTEEIPESYRLGVYRIVQELVHNIVKHATATHALVQLIMQNQVLSVTVEDDGAGFSPETQQERKGIGLENMDMRVKSMNGTYTLESSPGNGTSVHLEFELDYQQKTGILPDKTL